MSQSFSTDLVPVSDRLEAWLCNAKPTCGDCRFHFPRRQPFHGSIERRLLAGLDLTRFASTPVSFAKFPVVAGESEERGCIVITKTPTASCNTTLIFEEANKDGTVDKTHYEDSDKEMISRCCGQTALTAIMK